MHVTIANLQLQIVEVERSYSYSRQLRQSHIPIAALFHAPHPFRHR